MSRVPIGPWQLRFFFERHPPRFSFPVHECPSLVTPKVLTTARVSSPRRGSSLRAFVPRRRPARNTHAANYDVGSRDTIDRNAIRPKATHFFSCFLIFFFTLSARTLCWRQFGTSTHLKDSFRLWTAKHAACHCGKKLSVSSETKVKMRRKNFSLFLPRERRG